MHAEQHPYWAVVTWDKFKGPNQSPETLIEFFATGENHIAGIFKIIENIRPAFAPQTALDFGCGVGRLLIPLAARGSKVTGVDVSKKMLSLSRENLESRGLAAEGLVTTLDALPRDARYDLVHSFIVLQHIPVCQAVPIFEDLLSRVSEHGLAVLHLTYLSSKNPQRAVSNFVRDWCKGLVLRSRWLTRLFVKVRGKAPNPPMLMENFPLNSVFGLLHAGGFNNLHIRPSYHGMNGLVIFAQRTPGQSPQF